LRVIGICNVQVDRESTLTGVGFTRAARFWILLPSPNNIQVLQRPSWLTTRRIGALLLSTLAFTAAAFVWGLTLRRRVQQQTRELRESRELYRHMAHHDPLTGLATRNLFNDRLQTALDRAQRFHSIHALLLLDLDAQWGRSHALLELRAALPLVGIKSGGDQREHQREAQHTSRNDRTTRSGGVHTPF
jgi:hypothetical protein